MRRIFLRIIFVSLLVFPVICATAQIKSETSKIRINNTKQEVIQADLTLHQPSMEQTKVFVTPETAFDLAGEINPWREGLQVMIDNLPVENQTDNFFWQKIYLKPGANTLSITVVYKEMVVSQYTYRMFCTQTVESFAGASLEAGRYYALIIGINEYPLMGENLEHAVGDARAVYQVLNDRYTFDKEDMNLLLNPGREDLYVAFDRLSREVGPDDHLLIFYAGHGLWEENAGLGYWLPSDARQESRAAWFPNSSLVDYLKAIDSRHTLLISDACFAGSIFKTRSVLSDASTSIEELFRLPSRKAITSGTLSKVPDDSPFIKYLLDRLETNKDKYLPSESLYSRIRVAVENNSTTLPRTGVIQGVGDEGGDFIFILRKE